MKKCPQCAEEIQDDAKVCRYCNAPQSSNTAKIVFAALVIGALAIGASVLDTTGPDTQTAPPTLSPQQVENCTDLLRDGQRSGLIKERPATNRINVDDLAWARFPASAKQGILLALGCEAFAGHPLGDGDYVVAYGYRSGKRLAMLTSVGINYE